MTASPLPRPSAGLRTIALYEATKGTLVLLAGLGLLGLIHHHVQEAAEELVRTAWARPWCWLYRRMK